MDAIVRDPSGKFRIGSRRWVVAVSGVAAVAVAAGLGVLSLSGAGRAPAPATPGQSVIAHSVRTHSLAAHVAVWGKGAYRLSGGRANLTPGQAGYVASGRPFTYVQAVIDVPRSRCVKGSAQPHLFVALADRGAAAGGTYIRAGLLCGPSATSDAHASAATDWAWQGFAAVNDPARRSPALVSFPLGSARAGDGVFVSVSYDPTARVARTALVLPGGASRRQSVAIGPQHFTQAQALADWQGAAPATSSAPVLVTRFLSGEIITVNGARGVFAGPWTAKGDLSWRRWAVDADVITQGDARLTGQTVVSAPSRLWTDGTQSVYGSTGDAFGIWLFH